MAVASFVFDFPADVTVVFRGSGTWLIRLANGNRKSKLANDLFVQPLDGFFREHHEVRVVQVAQLPVSIDVQFHHLNYRYRQT